MSALRAAMVAGEPSGDLLAARIMAGLLDLAGGLQARGIGGPAMSEQGLESWYGMEQLAVFGYLDALRRAPSLIRTWRDTKRRVLAWRPDVFIGIDAPDFNLRLHEQLRAAGIPTVQFVGPSIWAWRFERIHQIRRAVSHMLVLFPFEVELYQKHGVPVSFVGHPLAAQIPMEPDRAGARALLGIEQDARVLVLLPGSRESELRELAPRFLQAAQILQRQDPQLQLLVPMVNTARTAQFQQFLAQYPVAACRVLRPEDLPPGAGGAPWPVSWHAMAAADAALAASGTATLEAALFKLPMVISYVLSPWMRRIMAWKSGQKAPLLPWVGLPNILLREFAVPELLQTAATAENLAASSWQALSDGAQRARVKEQFSQLHQSLSCDTAARAANAIMRAAGKI